MKVIDMGLFNNLSIRSKVISAFAGVLLCGTALGVWAVVEVRQLNASTAQINDKVGDLRLLSGMGVQLERIRLTDGLLVIAQTPDEQADLARSSADARRKFTTTLADYEATLSSGEERQLADGIRSGWERFEAAERVLAPLVQDGDRPKAEAALSGGIRREGVGLRSAIEKAAAHQERQADSVVTAAAAIGASAVTWIAVLLAMMVVVCVLAGTSMVRGVAAPVRAMTAAMRRLADRDMAVLIPGAGRGDEVGGMAAAVQVFKDNMITADRLAAE
ncbi:MCP four helix bundle domain-containing protein, partial [Teichococcus vastitatis]